MKVIALKAVRAMLAVSPVAMGSRVLATLAALTTTPVGMMPLKALSSRQPIRWLRNA